MRDGLSRPSSVRNPTGTSTTSGDMSVNHWRARLRAGVLGELAEATKGIVWNHELLMALLEELHVTEEFDRLIRRSRLDVVRDAPRLLALALFLRHSWDPADLSTVVDPVLGPPSRTGTHSSPTTRGDRGHRPSPPRPRAVLKKARTKGAAMTDTTVSRPRTPRGHRVRELVCSYRTLRDANGHVLDVPTLALSNPRVAASTLGGLLAGELVEVFAVACLSTRHRLLSWHVVSRGTRTSTPISIPDVFVPACLTPGTTGLIVVHNHPSGVMRTPDICGVGRRSLDGVPVRACRIARPRVIGVRIIVGHLSPHAVAGERGPMFIAATLHSLDDVLDAFTEHLRVARGASPATCERSGRDVRQLLTLLSASGQLDLRQLTGEVLRGFVVDRARRHSPRTARRSASAARSFVRFLHLHGVIDGRVAQAVPTVRDTRRATLPKALAPAQLRQLLAAVDPSTPAGRRDRAMLLCLASLGLRAKEVAELSLDGIDWRAGTLTLATSKARRAHRLPLPATVGRAIATYLRSGRPVTTVRQVFVRHFPPIGVPVTSAVVTRAVQRAFHRSGVDVASRGAHTLRHTAATAMVRAGVSLKAVADVLRHRSLDTTALYTKVDLPRLRDVARPWPEEVVS